MGFVNRGAWRGGRADISYQEDEIVINTDILGVRIPDSRIAREITQLIRDTESDLLFYHSRRVYFWGALTMHATRLASCM